MQRQPRLTPISLLAAGPCLIRSSLSLWPRAAEFDGATRWQDPPIASVVVNPIPEESRYTGERLSLSRSAFRALRSTGVRSGQGETDSGHTSPGDRAADRGRIIAPEESRSTGRAQAAPGQSPGQGRLVLCLSVTGRGRAGPPL
ncbi:hypothetical protein NDU88_006575 [Pleurodeles waltl]|uniref:Secreted protein n=1 Tax=Pleurodeles waltl TaxID=8319 RepID=A0AAV7VRS4_PLEWA|nr:hypothetical protein NDU88_006575 [Pleurodeles waltl]